MAIARQKLDHRTFDVLLITSDGLGELLAFRNHAKPVIMFCHTPVRPVYDPIYRRLWLDAHPAGRIPLAFFSFFYRRLTRQAWSYVRRVFVNGREVLGRVAAGGICPLEKVEILHPGVDVAMVTPTFTHERYFLYSGRIKWTKNVELAIDAFRTFRDGPLAEGWRLIVAGAVDASTRDYMTSLRRRAEGDDAISFVENPSDAELRGLYARSYALLFPPLNEDWGVVPLEAMAHGKPVLAVNCGGPAESVVDGETGYLLEPTPAAFARAMASLAAPSGLAERLGRQAAERAKRFSWDRFVKRLDDYVEDTPTPFDASSI